MIEIFEERITVKVREKGVLNYDERQTQGNKTYWFMDGFNYKFVNGVWSVLKEGVFIVCEKPGIEIMYQLIKNK